MRRTGLFLLVLILPGCVERTLTIRTDPPESLVYLNSVEVGRTPVKRDFVWYGTYDVVVRKEGYETLKTRGPVIAPWWQWVPFDLLAELVPLRLRDQQVLSYTLKPEQTAAVDPQQMLQRADTMRPMLESSQYTHAPIEPATIPTTRNSTKPSTRP